MQEAGTQQQPAEPWRAHYVHPCAWDQRFAPLSMPQLLADSAAGWPDRPVVEFFGRYFTYGEMARQARAFAAGLQHVGIAKGDRVGLYLPNVPLYLPAYYGAMLAGAVVVNFSPIYTAVELEAQVADSGARLIVTIDSSALLPTAVEVLRNSAQEFLVVGHLASAMPWWKGLALRLFGRAQLARVPKGPGILPWASLLAHGEPSPVAIDPEHDIALLQYTGGTTGSPKGAMLTHQNLSANARQINEIDPHAAERDMIMGALPLFHVFANSCVLNRTVVNGGCIAMVPRFEAGQVLKTLARVKATTMPGVPTMFQALLDHPDIARTDFTALRTCTSGGAPLPLPLKERFERATGAKLVEGYGLTESSGVVTANPYEGDIHPGSIGQPLPGTYLRLLDKEDPTLDAPPGEPGELAVLGPQIMQGYWQRPDAAAAAFALRGDDRWLRTGDIAMIDPDGYIRIVDRSKDMISVGGFKVYPSRVEAVLLQHPAVREALVIGVADQYRGEVPRAFVSLRKDAPAADSASLRDWLNSHVGKHERVDEVVVRDDLPKTMIGKLDRKALRSEVAAQAAG